MSLEILREEGIRWVEANRSTRFSGVTKLLTDLYPDNAHFIYELLQNAEDARDKSIQNSAGASMVRFTLTDDALEFEHNGKGLFTLDDVGRITGIGDSAKRDDPTSIGKFGIGFKAVFAYTNTPEIHSGDFHFRIHDLVVPETEGVTRQCLSERETRFIFPFDNPKKPSLQAVAEIEQGLRDLGDNTLLFLSHIRTVEYLLPDGTLGTLERIDHDGGHIEIRARHPGGKDTVSHWLRFQKEDVEVIEEEGLAKVCRIAIAYSLAEHDDNEAGNSSWKIVPLDHGQVSIYFPAEKEPSNLRFHIHAPFASTVARDSVRDCKANRTLIKAIAELTATSLEKLRDIGLLTVLSYNALPLRAQDFPQSGLYRTIYEEIRNAVETKALLPRHRGGYVSVNQARLAGSAQLAEVFSPAQLGKLFDQEILYWLDTSITEKDSTKDLHTFLVGKRKVWPTHEWEQPPLASGMAVDSGDLSKKLTAAFYLEQNEKWLEKFYHYISSPRNYPSFADTPFLRLENGHHVTPGKKDAPNAWLPSSNLAETDQDIFQPVKGTLAQIAGIYEFLKEKVGLREPNPVDIVKKCILPKYSDKQNTLSEKQVENWRSDFERILAIVNESADNKSKLIPELKHHYIVLVEQNISGERNLVLPGAAYLHSEETDCFFQGNAVIKFVPGDVGKQFKDLLLVLEVADSPRMIKSRTADRSGRISYGWKREHGCYRRGLDFFDITWEIDGLDYAVAHPTVARSLLLWKFILENRKCIRGVVENCTRQNFSDPTPKNEISSTGHLLIENSWLPDVNGDFYLPSSLLLSDLPDGYEKISSSALELSEKLEMKQPERMQAVDFLAGGDSRKKKLIEAIVASEDKELEKFEKLIPSEQLPGKFRTFQEEVKSLRRSQRQTSAENSLPPNGVRDPERYQEKLDAEAQKAVEEAKTQPRAIRFSLVRAQDSNSEARDFLYQQYAGRCQVTGETFVKANGNNYYEAVTLVPRLDAEHLNNAGNMLCLSAETAAKFFYGSFDWLDDLETKILEFKTEKDGGTLENRQLRIQLVGQEATITWTEQHFMRLISLWRHA